MTYACFIDYSKSFDTVRHEPLIDLMKAIDVDSNDVQLLAKSSSSSKWLD